MERIGFLKATNRQTRWIPIVETQNRWRVFFQKVLNRDAQQGFIDGHVARAARRFVIDQAPRNLSLIVLDRVLDVAFGCFSIHL